VLVEDRCGLFRSLDHAPSVQCGLMLARPTHEYEVSMLNKSPSRRRKSLSVPAKGFGQAISDPKRSIGQIAGAQEGQQVKCMGPIVQVETLSTGNQAPNWPILFRPSHCIFHKLSLV
jgi:hypothetical protein